MTDNMIIRLVATHWKTEDESFIVNQPRTGVQVILTGTTLRVFKYMKQNKNIDISVGDLISNLKGSLPGLSGDRIREIVIHLSNLEIVQIDKPSEW